MVSTASHGGAHDDLVLVLIGAGRHVGRVSHPAIAICDEGGNANQLADDPPDHLATFAGEAQNCVRPPTLGRCRLLSPLAQTRASSRHDRL
jgi:hypothetical protein